MTSYAAVKARGIHGEWVIIHTELGIVNGSSATITTFLKLHNGTERWTNDIGEATKFSRNKARNYLDGLNKRLKTNSLLQPAGD